MPMATNVAPDISHRTCSVPSKGRCNSQQTVRVLIFERRPEIRGVTGQPNCAGCNRQRGAERKLPDEEKRDQPPKFARTINFAQVAYDPPDPGMAAPSSAHTRPSHMAKTAPRTQPSMACGPPMALTISGMVMNGPTPIMSIMFSAVALQTPMPRIRGWELRWSFRLRRWSLVVGRWPRP